MKKNTGKAALNLEKEVFEVIRNTLFLNVYDYVLSYPMQVARRPTSDQLSVLMDGFGVKENIKRIRPLIDEDDAKKIAEQDLRSLQKAYDVFCILISPDVEENAFFDEKVPELLAHPLKGAIDILSDCVVGEMGAALYSLVDWVKNCENQKLLYKIAGKRLPISGDDIRYAIDNNFMPTTRTKELVIDIEGSVRKKSSQKATKAKSEADKNKRETFEIHVLETARAIKNNITNRKQWGVVGLERMARLVSFKIGENGKKIKPIKEALRKGAYPKKRTGEKKKT